MRRQNEAPPSRPLRGRTPPQGGGGRGDGGVGAPTRRHHLLHAASLLGIPPVAPEPLMSTTSLSLKPSTFLRISSVCSPSSGERFTSLMLSDNLIGLPTDRYLPRVGCSTSTTVPDLRSDGSSASSCIDRIGPHGMSYWLRIFMASNLVLVMVHCSMVSKICLSRGSRASGLA